MCHKKLVFFQKMLEDQHLCAERKHYLAVIVFHNWYVLKRIMCALVRSWKQQQRIVQDYILYKS